MPHVILFLQFEIGLETRTHSIYDSVNECMEGVCKIYKAHLIKLNPNVQITTFKMTQLFEFIDHLADIKCFVFQRNTKKYASFNKNWIKEEIHEFLKCQSTQRICKIYEIHLKKLNPNVPSISYDMSEMFEFIDHLSDLSCLVFQRNTRTYVPFDRMWIKQKIYDVLRHQANVQQQ